MTEKATEGEDRGILQFHYVKSGQFRVAHVDGAQGGISPRGMIQVNFFNERAPIPQVVEHWVTPDGIVQEERKEGLVVRSGVIREVEFAAVMSLETAEALSGWLHEKVQTLKGIKEERGNQ